MRLLLASVLFLILVEQANAQQPVTLAGQFVCSLCWFEADRNTTPYGTDADIKCAKECAEKGIPPAIAVQERAGYTLYIVEKGRFKKDNNWLDYLGKQVSISGRVREKEDKRYVAVDDLQVIASPEAEKTQSSVIGTEAELALKDLFGIDQNLSAYRGRVVVLNFWATWCVPCRKEMPDLAAIQNDYAAFGVQVIGASADTIADRSKVMQFIRESRINFPVWLGATTEDMKRFGLGPGLPGTAVIGRDGKILSVHLSVITQNELRKQIDALLASDAAAVKRVVASAKPEPRESSLIPS